MLPPLPLVSLSVLLSVNFLTVASVDDELGMIYLEGGDITNDMLKAAIRKATIARLLVPCVLGSARRNKGVQPLIDAVIDYLPCPTDVPAAKGLHIKKDKEEEEIGRASSRERV